MDNDADVAALASLREKFPKPIFSVDLQENYKLAPKVAPLVNKIRYNPGHLFHLEKDKSIEDKVKTNLRNHKATLEQQLQIAIDNNQPDRIRYHKQQLSKEGIRKFLKTKACK